MSKMDNIWVGSKPSRGSSDPFPTKENFKRIDVSSGSMNKINWSQDNLQCDKSRSDLLNGLYMRNLSPLLIGPVYDTEGNEYIRFENLWQYNKVYPQLGHWDPINKRPTPKWYAWRLKGMTKLKNGKGIRTPDEVSRLKKSCKDGKISSWKPIGAWWNNRLLNYIDSRIEIYIPVYSEAIKKTKEFKLLDDMSKNGVNMLLIELDGPNLKDFPNGMLANKENINDMLYNEKYPFGHCYVIAMCLQNK